MAAFSRQLRVFSELQKRGDHLLIHGESRRMPFLTRGGLGRRLRGGATVSRAGMRVDWTGAWVDRTSPGGHQAGLDRTGRRDYQTGVNRAEAGA